MIRSIPGYRSVLCGLSLLLPAAAAQDDLTWRGEVRTVESIAAEWPAVADAIRVWLPFARERNGRLVLSDDRRVLLVLGEHHARRGRTERKAVEKMLAVARETLVATDCFLPPVDDEPLVVVSTKTSDYPRLLGHVAALEPLLADWAQTMANRAAGFVLSQPPVAAWIEDPRDVDEWRPENELVHRLAQLTLRTRAQGLPDWLQVGLAWHVEDSVCRGIYCYPNRSGFVSVTEHTGWGNLLAGHFKPSNRKKAGRPKELQIDEFAGWRAGSSGTEYTDGTAWIAFGLARYLAQEHGDAVPGLVAALGDAYADGSRTWISEFEWRSDPDYRVPAESQAKLLAAISPDLLSDAAEFFRQKKVGDRRRLATSRR